MSSAGEADTLEPHVQYWKTRWEENKIGWHIDDVNPNLINFLGRLTNSSTTKKIFVPLCGKTRDIAYLLSHGFEVFGIEGVRQAIEELDKENSFNLKFNEKELLYHTQDNRLQIYAGDLFKCPIEKWGPFDFIWDRGSFIAMEYPFRPAYKEMMQRSLRNSNSKYHDFRYLLETVRYEKSKYPGPPRSVDEKDMEEFFEDWTNVEILKIGPVDSIRVRDAVAGSPCDSIIYLLTPKWV